MAGYVYGITSTDPLTFRGRAVADDGRACGQLCSGMASYARRTDPGVENRVNSGERLPCSERMARRTAAIVQRSSVTLPEWRRLDAERPQIHVSLAAMMYLVIDGVLNRHHPGGLPLAERLVDFAEPVR